MQESALRAERAAIVDHTRAPSTPRLLVVDDVADNRDLIIRRFQRRNYQVDEADGGGARPVYDRNGPLRHDLA